MLRLFLGRIARRNDFASCSILQLTTSPKTHQWRSVNVENTSRSFWTKFNCHSWGNGQEKQRRSRFQQSKILFPPFLFMAVALNHEETDLKDPETLKNEKEVSELLKKGRKMLDTKCRLESVEEVYTEALHLALTNKDKSIIAYVQDQLANLSLRQGKLEEAEKLFKNVIRNLIDNGMKENHVAIIEISLKLATIYASAKNNEFATLGYEFVIEKCRENLQTLKNKPNDKNFDYEYKNQIALLGMALDSYGRFLYMTRNLKQALDVTRESCEISTELFGENDIRTLVILNDIGAILNESGSFEEAAKVIEKAIEAANRRDNPDHADIAVFWVNLSSVYKKQGDDGMAENAFENARKEAKLANDKDLKARIEQYIKTINKA